MVSSGIDRIIATRPAPFIWQGSGIRVFQPGLITG